MPKEIENLFNRMMAKNRASRKNGQPNNDIFQMFVETQEKQSE